MTKPSITNRQMGNGEVYIMDEMKLGMQPMGLILEHVGCYLEGAIIWNLNFI